jgi:hypothetical protein
MPPSAVNLGGQASEEVVLTSRDDLVSILRERCDENFDGECHLTNAEADRIIRFIDRTPSHPSGDTGEIGEVVKMLRVGSPELNHAFTITSRDSYRAATLIEQQAATIAGVFEKLEAIERLSRHADQRFIADLIGEVLTQIRATLERTKQP